jgi:hypothetical protein
LQAATPGSYGQGYIAEVIVYGRPLMQTDMQSLEGWVASKYGLGAWLPTNHPFYNSSMLSPPSGGAAAQKGGPIVWLRPNELPPPGTTVTQWTGVADSANAVLQGVVTLGVGPSAQQVNFSSAPVVAPSVTLNGWSVLQFSGAQGSGIGNNLVVDTPDVNGLVTNGSQYSIFIVAAQYGSNPNTQNRVVSSLHGSMAFGWDQGVQDMVTVQNPPSPATSTVTIGAGPTNNGTHVIADTFFMYSITASGSSLALYRNGLLIANHSGAVNGPAGFSLGGGQGQEVWGSNVLPCAGDNTSCSAIAEPARPLLGLLHRRDDSVPSIPDSE